MKFDDKESSREVTESLRFNNSANDTDTNDRIGSNLPDWQDPERNEDMCFNNSPDDPNTLQRLGVGSTITSTNSIGSQERSEI